jgi:hypothetical protein
LLLVWQFDGGTVLDEKGNLKNNLAACFHKQFRKLKKKKLDGFNKELNDVSLNTHYHYQT